MLKCTTEVYRCRLVWQGIRKWSEWRNKKLKNTVIQKIKAFEQWLQHRSEGVFDMYRDKRKRLKAVVRNTKREAKDVFGTKPSQNFKSIWKMFWKEVKRAWKGV